MNNECLSYNFFFMGFQLSLIKNITFLTVSIDTKALKNNYFGSVKEN